MNILERYKADHKDELDGYMETLKEYKTKIALGAAIPAALVTGAIIGSCNAERELGEELYSETTAAVYSGHELSGNPREIKRITSCTRDVDAAMRSSSKNNMKSGLNRARIKYGDSLFLAALKAYPVRNQRTGDIIPMNEAFRGMAYNAGGGNTRFGEDPLGTSSEIAMGMIISGILGKDYDLFGNLLDAVYEPASPDMVIPGGFRNKSGVINTRSRGRVVVNGDGEMLFNPIFNKSGRLVQYSPYFSDAAQREAEERVSREMSQPRSLSGYIQDVGRALEAKQKDDNEVRRRVYSSERRSNGTVIERVGYGTKADVNMDRRNRAQRRAEESRKTAGREFNKQVRIVQKGFNQGIRNAQKQIGHGTRQARRDAEKRQRDAQKNMQNAWKGFENNFIIPLQRSVGYRK